MEGQTCGGGGYNKCGSGPCVPLTCEQANATCGMISDGCGHVVECGSCPSGQPCKGNQCECTPVTCASVGATCGNLSDGCGKVLDCGACPPGLTCSQNACSCEPKTCASAGASCGNISDGCGKAIDCGSCQPGSSCKNNQCCSGTELCGNGVDDDCDGEADEGCNHACEEADGNGCNGDAGYGDHCDPQDNTGGCSPDRFWAWCNRRNSDLPDIWEDYLKGWVDDRCDGKVSLVDPEQDGYETYVCTDSNGQTWSCTTPLVLSFDPAGSIGFAPFAPGFIMDRRSGALVGAWPAADSPWLAWDRDGSGAIEDGAELFGSASRLLDGRSARNGFEALSELDSDGDGVIDASDAGFCRILLWRDLDGNGQSSPDELEPIARTGVIGLSVRASHRFSCDSERRCFGERAEFRWVDPAGETRAGVIVDLYLPTAR